MPELPDVEGFKQIASQSLKQKISTVVVVAHPGEKVRTVQNISPEKLKQACEGLFFTDVKRRGKFLILKLSSNDHLVFHFMLTGYLYYLPTGQVVPPEVAANSRVVFLFTTSSQLIMADRRNLGKLFFVNDAQFNVVPLLNDIGTEPLSPEFTFSLFKRLAAKAGARKVKDFLVDQRFIAGIGNIYSDQIMWQAHVRPDREVASLSEEELKLIYQNIKKELQLGLETVLKGKEPEANLLTVRRKGLHCPRCTTPLAAIKRGATHSYFCPQCQK